MRSAVFFGDSLTRADYVARGFVEILAVRCPGVRVSNHGVNGDTSRDLLERVEAVRSEQAERIYVMVGTNDCGWGIPVDQYRADLEGIVAALRPSEVLFITPTTSVALAAVAAPYIEAVKAVAAQEGAKVIDFAAHISSTDYDWDGLHWNEQGHRRLADLIEREAPLC